MILIGAASRWGDIRGAFTRVAVAEQLLPPAEPEMNPALQEP